MLVTEAISLGEKKLNSQKPVSPYFIHTSQLNLTGTETEATNLI